MIKRIVCLYILLVGWNNTVLAQVKPDSMSIRYFREIKIDTTLRVVSDYFRYFRTESQEVIFDDSIFACPVCKKFINHQPIEKNYYFCLSLL